MPGRILALFGTILSLAFVRAPAQGGSAVITLVMPPAGGDGYSALQTGAARASGAASLYYNPALLADLQHATGSQFFATHSSQNLLPVLELPDLEQSFGAVAVAIPDPVSGVDMGVGFFRNRMDFGKNTVADAGGTEIGHFESYETVYGLGIAARLGIPISFGVTAKFYASHIARGFSGAHPAYGWAFDGGVLMNPRLSPSGSINWPAIVVTPSMAMTARNLGPDVFYAEAWQADPIPTTYSVAYAAKLDAFELLALEGGLDFDQEWTRRSEEWDPVRTMGYSASALIFRYGESWLKDAPGRRDEKHHALSLEVNVLRLHRFWRRLQTGDFQSPSSHFDAGYPFRDTRFLGMRYRANPRFEWGFRKIESRDGGIREGQKSYYLGFSL